MPDVEEKNVLLPKFDNSYSTLPNRFYAKNLPVPVDSPELIILNEPLANYLGFESSWLKSSSCVNMFSGNSLPDGTEPLSMAYAGHQFGHWISCLGDGRAVLLGEMIATDNKRYDIQLKGSGQTLFSRTGDGRAWIGPIMREYIVSEAMNALGILTTRALAVVTTGEMVLREKAFPGGIITRVASSHIRVGTFQYFAARGDIEGLRILADYTIQRLYPEIMKKRRPYLSFLEVVVSIQAKLIAHWMSVGFIHGVMNTDNMAISGETIDYGPCAFMDDYHPDKVFSSIDKRGYYAYRKQNRAAHWNLVCLAKCLLPLLDENERKALSLAQQTVDHFSNQYQKSYNKIFGEKIGLPCPTEDNNKLIFDLLVLMESHHCDFTHTFYTLSEVHDAEGEDNAFLVLFNHSTEARRWFKKWRTQIGETDESLCFAKEIMRMRNPAIIPRNHHIDRVIHQVLESGSFKEFYLMNKALQNPYSRLNENDIFSSPPLEEDKVKYTFCGT
ncbi:protein adenylyltransferase SelO [Candidatus Endowatersipora endosymbiont of Watersipora subatra]|uniref:protein adenylyltransferase SelO n=1 Tax=Candidatus Endowatersipora endosymbiont of Watersipora subatra TaxID=3077946 RepID=UPI00312CA234